METKLEWGQVPVLSSHDLLLEWTMSFYQLCNWRKLPGSKVTAMDLGYLSVWPSSLHFLTLLGNPSSAPYIMTRPGTWGVWGSRCLLRGTSAVSLWPWPNLVKFPDLRGCMGQV